MWERRKYALLNGIRVSIIARADLIEMKRRSIEQPDLTAERLAKEKADLKALLDAVD